MLSLDSRHWARALACGFIAHVTLASPIVVHAQTTSTWQASGTAAWNDPGNWDLGVPMLAGDVAIFGTGFPTADVLVLVADPTTTVGTLTYDNPFQLELFASVLTFDGNGVPALVQVLDGQLNFQSGSYVLASDLDLSVASGLTTSIGASLNPGASFSGSGGLNILGGGTVVLNGANTYGGATHINNGLLRVQHNDSLGLGTGADIDGTFIHAGGTLELGKDTLTLPNEKIIVDGGTLTGGRWTLAGPVQMNDGLITGNGWTINGPLSISGGAVNGGQWRIAGPLTLDGTLTVNGGGGRISGLISGSGGIDLNAPGELLQIIRANTYTGQTIISGGTLNLGTSLSLGAGTGTDADGTIVRAGGTLQIGLNVLLANEKIILDGGELSGATGVAIQVDAPISSDGGTFKATDWVLNSNIELPGDLTIDAGRGGTMNGTILGPGALIFNRGDVKMFGDASAHTGQTRIENNVTLTVQGASSLGAGETVIDAGELWVTHPMALNGGKITVNTLGQLHFQDVPSATVDIQLVGGSFSTVGDTVLNGQIELGAGTNTINSSPSRDLDLDLDLIGDGDLRYAQGTILLNRGYSYTGQTIIDGSAVVRVGHANSLGDAATGTVIQGGTLSILAPTNESLTIRGGDVFIETSSNNITGSITMSGGVLTIGNQNIPFATPITLEPGLSSFGARDTVFSGGTTGAGDLRFLFGTIVDGAPLAHDGGFILAFESTALNTPNTYTGETTILGGSHVINHRDALGDNLVGTVVNGGELIFNVAPDEDFEILNGGVTNQDTTTPYTRTIMLNTRSGGTATVGGVGTFDGEIILGGLLGGGLRGGVYNGVISGDARFFLGGPGTATTDLNAHNTYTSLTNVYGGTNNVNHPFALGSDSAGTVVSGGTLRINTPTTEKITLDSSGTIEINTQLADFPDILPGAIGRIEINTASQYNQRIDLNGATLNINQNTQFASLTMRDESRLLIAAGARLDLTGGELRLHSGILSGNLSGIPVIRKQTHGRTFIRDAFDLDGRLILERGILWIEEASLTSTPAASIEFDPDGQAALWVDKGNIIDAEIFLNNTHGYRYGGALFARKDFSGNPIPEIRGDVHLGSTGATIGGDNSPMNIQGAITGGDLRVNFNGSTLVISGDNNTYTGITDLMNGKIQLLRDGTLMTTEKFVIGSLGGLSVSNNETLLTDRVGDHIPIQMYGGFINSSVTDRTSTSETFGDLSLVRGHAEIDAFGGFSQLTFNSLTQEPSATVLMHIDEELAVFFQQAPALDDGIMGGWAFVRGDDNRIHFATYDTATGVQAVSITPHTVNTAGPNNNVTHANGGPALASDAVINSLTLRGSLDLGGNTLRVETGGIIGSTISNGNLTAGDGSGGTLYLYGGTYEASLTDDGSNPVSVVSYAGLFSGVNTYSGSTTINDRRAIIENEGALPQGTDVILNGSGLEFRYASATPRQLGTLTLRDGSLIEENSGGNVLLDFSALELEAGEIREVELVGAGTMRKTTHGAVGIEGANPNYTGPVEVYDGVLQANWHTSVGTGPITIYGGTFIYADDATPGFSNNITLAGGTLSGYNDTKYSGPIFISASSTIEHLNGDLFINGDLSGDAALSFDKQIGDAGVIHIRGENNGFSGPIYIRGGVVQIDPQAVNGLGSGPVTIYLGGALQLQIPITANDIHLNGGELLSRYEPDAEVAGDIYVHADSRIGSNNDGLSLVLSGAVTLEDNQTLTHIGGARLSILNELRIGQGTTFEALQGTVGIDGVIVANDPLASLDLIQQTVGEFDLNESIHVPAGRSLAITMDGQDFELIFNSPSQSVSGGGTLFNDLTLSNGAAMMPGSSAGTFTVDGDYTQLVDALLQIELGGTAGGQFDVLSVTGLFDAGGIFELLLIDDFVPVYGDAFGVLDFGTLVTGSAFDQVLLPELGLGLSWDTQDLLNTGEIRVVPEPVGVLGLGVCLVLLRRRCA